MKRRLFCLTTLVVLLAVIICLPNEARAAEMRLQAAMLENAQTGEKTELPLDGLFISIGRDPQTSLFAGQLALDSAGYIVADESTCTSVSGVFAAGNVRTKALRKIVTAAGDGAAAAHVAEQYLLNIGQPLMAARCCFCADVTFAVLLWCYTIEPLEGRVEIAFCVIACL